MPVSRLALSNDGLLTLDGIFKKKINVIREQGGLVSTDLILVDTLINKLKQIDKAIRYNHDMPYKTTLQDIAEIIQINIQDIRVYPTGD